MESQRPAHLVHRSAADRARSRARPAQLLGKLDPASFGLVLTSPRQRARVTAELAGFTGEYEPRIDPDLVEWDYGAYEGLTRAQIHEQVPDWLIWTHGGGPAGETIDDVRARFRRLISADRGGEGGSGDLLRARARAAGPDDRLARAGASPSARTSSWTPRPSRC